MTLKNIKKKSNIDLVKIVISLIFLVIFVFLLVKLLNYFYFKKIEKFENSQVYTSGINNADKILFINLKDRKDRFESIMAELTKQGAAADKIYRIDAHYTPGNGHLGCAKSHYDAMQYAIDNNLNNVIVFEDDFIFSTKPDETNKMFNDLFNNVDQNEWDIVLFAHTYAQHTDTKYPFLHKIIVAQTSSGYIVPKKYFKTLQDVFKKSVDNIKQEKTTNSNFEPYALDQLWKENQKTDKWLGFTPALGKQDDKSASTIQEITNYNNS
jgi:GR25 family glycosyltransferase involved in LPS biosynthesis